MRVIIILSFLVFSFNVSAQNAPIKLKDGKDSLSYALGIMFGQNIKSGGFDHINADIFARTVEKVLANETLALNQDEASRIVDKTYQQNQKIKNEQNLKAGRDFLATNKSKPGVVTLSSGLQYKVMKMGTGAKPSLNDKVTVHYHGTLIDGSIFDSSVERNQPIELTVSHVIPGWIEALQMMPVGSKWIVYVPFELAYGANPPSGVPIEPNSALIYAIELLSINN
ncbi:MAG: FKBP-type peptidyl-prolyl cis-trans isomerase [Bacteroidales bacterium]|nr:FKBP-type peptidyl-prolyl cis-trans isomerase [Bacteroidales bacterium]